MEEPALDRAAAGIAVFACRPLPAEEPKPFQARLMPMPRFYFQVCNGNGFTEDEAGKVVPDLPTARREAITTLRSLLAADMNSGHVNMSSFIEIEDEEHRLMMTIQFMDAVEISTERCSRARA